MNIQSDIQFEYYVASQGRLANIIPSCKSLVHALSWPPEKASFKLSDIYHLILGSILHVLPTSLLILTSTLLQR